MLQKDEFDPQTDEMQYVLDEVFPSVVQALVRTQKEAAEEQGYRRYFGEDMWDERLKGGYNPPKYSASGDLLQWPAQDGQRTWSAKYLDFEKDLPTASTAEGLESQIALIGRYNDRTTAQKDYLVNKAITRYWVQQLSDGGMGEGVVKSVLGRKAGGNPGLNHWLTDDWMHSNYTGDAMPWASDYDQERIVPRSVCGWRIEGRVSEGTTMRALR